MEIEDLEDDLVTKLQTSTALAAIAEVIPMPEDDDGFNLPMKKGKVVVGYQMSDYGNVVTTAGDAQPEKATVIVTLQSRTLRGTEGIYTLFKLVKASLIGYKPKDCTNPIRGKWFGPPELGTKIRADDVFTWEFHIETDSVLVQTNSVDGTISPEDDEHTMPPGFPIIEIVEPSTP